MSSRAPALRPWRVESGWIKSREGRPLADLANDLTTADANRDLIIATINSLQCDYPVSSEVPSPLCGHVATHIDGTMGSRKFCSCHVLDEGSNRQRPGYVRFLDNYDDPRCKPT